MLGMFFPQIVHLSWVYILSLALCFRYQPCMPFPQRNHVTIIPTHEQIVLHVLIQFLEGTKDNIFHKNSPVILHYNTGMSVCRSHCGASG